VSSSLKAIANSFNFKRIPSVKSSDSQTSHPTYPNILDDLASHSVPYSSIPESLPSDMPQTDHFKFSTPDTTMQEHIEDPSGTHLLTNANPNRASPAKTTIRLVSASAAVPIPLRDPGTPLLSPVDPPFDLVMGSPGQSRVPVWPLSPNLAPSERLYPTLPIDELEDVKQNKGETKSVPSQAAAGSTSKPKAYPRPSNNVQDMFSPAPKPPIVPKESSGVPRSEPFLFGSPLPRHSVSNKAFDAAAASVLEEMNKRLSAAGVQKVDADVFGGSAIAKTTNVESGNLRTLGKADRFDKAHEEQFNKMDSIATHYAARRSSQESRKRKSDVLGRGSGSGTKRPSAGTRVISAGSRKRMGIPGGFDDEEEEALPDEVQEEEDRRMSKRVRIIEGDGGKDKGRRLTISPRKSETEEKQAARERAATRKMLDARKEKRRSSRHGRVSTAGAASLEQYVSPFQKLHVCLLTTHHSPQIKAKQSLALGFSPQPSRLCAVCGTLARVPPRKVPERPRPQQRQQPSHRLTASHRNLRKQSPDLLRNRLSQRSSHRGHLPAGRVWPPPALCLRQTRRQQP
jgi:hypothetical protein